MLFTARRVLYYGVTVATYTKTKLSQRKDGQFHRTIGQTRRDDGAYKPRRFLLGTNHTRARLGSALLEQLWEQVVEAHDYEQQRDLEFLDRGETLLRSIDDPTAVTRAEIEQSKPHWDQSTMGFANVARLGGTTFTVARHTGESARDYTERLAEIAAKFPTFRVVATPEDAHVAADGRSHFEGNAESLMAQASHAARVADTSVPRLTGSTLYEAIESYASQAVNGKEGGNVEAANARRLKDSIQDADLGEFGYSSLETIRNYWRNRPNGKKTGKPIAVSTVDNHLSTARRFTNWLDRTDKYDWELPKRGLEALKANIKQLRRADELSVLAQGAQVFNVDQMAAIWRHATDRERLFVVTALNAAMAPAELSSLRWNEISGDPPRIKRIRHKSGVYAEFALWPETVQALDWWRRTSPHAGELVFVTDDGSPYMRQRFSNAWGRLRKRIEREMGQDIPWWLPFKHLRKTAAQLVRDASDGEIAGVFLSHGKPVQTDDLSDLYSKRPFHRVDAALADVQKRLGPVFATAADAFTSTSS